MKNPIVIFRLWPDAADDEDGEWGVSIGGKNPDNIDFFGCKNEKHAKIVKSLFDKYFIIERRLAKEMRMSITKYTDVYDEIFRMTFRDL